MDKSIQNDFIQGVYEVFSTMFNEGVEDRVNLYLLSDTQQDDNPYGEKKYRSYKTPITLVSKVSEKPLVENEPIKAQKYNATFSIPLKSLTDNGLDMNDKEVQVSLRSAVIEFKGRYFNVDTLQGSAFVENVYLIWNFYCTEDLNISELSVIEEETNDTAEESDEDIGGA